jgi:hypothetical protein
MNFYSSVAIDKRFDGKRVYKTLIYPVIEIDPMDIYIVSDQTMYLYTLAQKYYNDVSNWKLIALANNIGKGRLSVPPGIQLRIPMNLTKINDDIKRLNR